MYQHVYMYFLHNYTVYNYTVYNYTVYNYTVYNNGIGNSINYCDLRYILIDSERGQVVHWNTVTCVSTVNFLSETSIGLLLSEHTRPERYMQELTEPHLHRDYQLTQQFIMLPAM